MATVKIYNIDDHLEKQVFEDESRRNPASRAMLLRLDVLDIAVELHSAFNLGKVEVYTNNNKLVYTFTPLQTYGDLSLKVPRANFGADLESEITDAIYEELNNVKSI